MNQKNNQNENGNIIPFAPTKVKYGSAKGDHDPVLEMLLSETEKSLYQSLLAAKVTATILTEQYKKIQDVQDILDAFYLVRKKNTKYVAK